MTAKRMLVSKALMHVAFVLYAVGCALAGVMMERDYPQWTQWIP